MRPAKKRPFKAKAAALAPRGNHIHGMHGIRGGDREGGQPGAAHAFGVRELDEYPRHGGRVWLTLQHQRGKEGQG